MRDVLRDEPKVRAVLDDTALARLFEPLSYLGSADAFIERVLSHH